MNVFMRWGCSQYWLSLFDNPLELETFNCLHLIKLTADTKGWL